MRGEGVGSDGGSPGGAGSGSAGVIEAPRILDWLRERTPSMVELLRELVLLESPSRSPATQGPVFDVMARELEAVGFEVRRLGGRATGGQLHARPRRRRKGHPAQAVIGHVDTVWPVGTLSEMPFVVEEGRIRGPGVFDMKGGLVQFVFALRALDALDLEPDVTPVAFLNSDEEIGSPESENRIRHLARRVRRALILEPGLGPEGRLKTSRRGGGRYRVVVTGKRAHTGLAPGEGASAIHELSHVILDLCGMADPGRGVAVNVGEVRGGSAANVVAGEAEAEVDIRVRTREDARRIEKRISELAARSSRVSGTTVHFHGAVDREPMEPTPRNRRLWHAAREIGAAMGIELEEGMSGGGSDGNTTSLHTATIDGLGAVGDGAHAVHEYLEIDRMPERAALLAGLLLLPAGEADRSAPGTDRGTDG